MGPGDEIDQFYRQRMHEYRERELLDCDDPSKLSDERYVYLTDVGRGAWGATAEEAARNYEEALRWYREADPRFDARKAASDRGSQLGHGGSASADRRRESRADRVAVIEESVTLRGGVVRGLVHNLSDSLWARDVSVAIGGGLWGYPLSVQPGETAPFEVVGWNGAQAPTVADISVSASLSAEVDISRALRVDGTPGYWARSPRGKVHPFPYWVMPGPFGEIEAAFGTRLAFREPTSHPHLAERVMSQQIDYLRAFVAFKGYDGGILEVRELTPYAAHLCEHNGQEAFSDAPVRRVRPGDPEATVAFALDVPGDFILWFGGSDTRDAVSDALHQDAPEPTLYPDPIGPCYLPPAPWKTQADDTPADAGDGPDSENGPADVGDQPDPGDGPANVGDEPDSGNGPADVGDGPDSGGTPTG